MEATPDRTGGGGSSGLGRTMSECALMPPCGPIDSMIPEVTPGN